MLDDKILNALSDAQIEEFKVKYAKVPSVITLLAGIEQARIGARVMAEEALKAQVEHEATMARFQDGIAKAFSKLPHPDEVHNVYASWQEVDVPTGEPEEVEVVKMNEVTGKPVAGEDGKPVTEKVMRTPTTKVWQWVVEVNHAMAKPTTKAGTSAQATTKRAITVYKREGTNLIAKGNFTSASKACEKLGLTIGGDSATRVLAREGYITEGYMGTDFTG